jgi:hypothetical protein
LIIRHLLKHPTFTRSLAGHARRAEDSAALPGFLQHFAVSALRLVLQG